MPLEGQWRPFPKVPHLLQYVSNGNYYDRINVGGKAIRESLESDVCKAAKLRLADSQKEPRAARCLQASQHGPDPGLPRVMNLLPPLTQRPCTQVSKEMMINATITLAFTKQIR